MQEQVTPKVKAATRKADSALKTLRGEKESLENELRETKQELQFVKAEKNDILMEVRYLRGKLKQSNPITSPRVDSSQTPSSPSLHDLSVKLKATEDLLRVLCAQGDGDVDAALEKLTTQSAASSERSAGVRDRSFSQQCRNLEEANEHLVAQLEALKLQLKEKEDANVARVSLHSLSKKWHHRVKAKILALKDELEKAVSARNDAKREISILKRKLVQKLEQIRKQGMRAEAQIRDLKDENDRLHMRLRQSVSREETLLAAQRKYKTPQKAAMGSATPSLSQKSPVDAHLSSGEDHSAAPGEDVGMLKQTAKVEGLLARSKAREFEARDRQRSAEKKIEAERTARNRDYESELTSRTKEVKRLEAREAELLSQIETMHSQSRKDVPFDQSSSERRLVEKIISELGATLQTLDELRSPHVGALREAYHNIASEMGFM